MDALEQQIFDQLKAAGAPVASVKLDTSGEAARWVITMTNGNVTRMNSAETAGFAAILKASAELPPLGAIR